MIEREMVGDAYRTESALVTCAMQGQLEPDRMARSAEIELICLVQSVLDDRRLATSVLYAFAATVAEAVIRSAIDRGLDPMEMHRRAAFDLEQQLAERGL